MDRFDYVRHMAAERGWTLPDEIREVVGKADEQGSISWYVNGRRMP